eukprot:GFUD01073844.1.p1 GENE.GFUD01073844.1~~GFUD01073844.1.p1  ORF type:complete len:254 (+),score=27.04 GFUD01073844.1:91-852(+)
MKIFVALPQALCFLLLVSEVKADDYILDEDKVGVLPQQVYIEIKKVSKVSRCTGTMITAHIAITAGHCVSNRTKDSDVMVYPPQKKCNSMTEGIPACKVEHQFTGQNTGCTSSGYDIALVRLSKGMSGMSTITQNMYSGPPILGSRTVMAGTGINNDDKCQSLISYQTAVDCTADNCHSGSQWYCTKGINKISGACSGDSGGPSWSNNGKELTGITSNGNQIDGCTLGVTVFSNIAFYKTWIEQNMAGPLARC